MGLEKRYEEYKLKPIWVGDGEIQRLEKRYEEYKLLNPLIGWAISEENYRP